MAAQRQSSFVAVGRASLTAAAALSLVRVFPRGSWLVPVLVAACIPPLVFALGERRRWNVVVVVAVTAVAGAWLALVVDDPSATAAGLPTTSALSTLRHDLAAAPHVLRTATVPVEPLGSALLIAVIAALIAALVTELIARRLMAPMGAIGPSVALYIAVSALGSGPWAATTAWYALAVVAYLVALQQTELSARRTWFQTGHERHSRLVSGGIAGGAVAIALAIAVGPGLPGARSAAWINYRSIGAGDGGNELKTPSPLATVSAKLSGINANEEIFTVKTSDNHPYRWRVIALDEFSSDPGSKNDWTAGGKERSARTLAGPTAQSSSRLVTQRFRLGPIDPYWLPAAYRPVAIDLANAAVLSNSTASLFLASSTLDKVSYQVTSEVANPGVQVLERATFADLRAAAADTRLPGDFPGDARALARALTKDAHTPYDQAVALESYFQRSGLFTYDTKVQLGNSPDALHTFLFVDRRGFCEQFATAYAELARAIGLPARVAVGYQSGTYDPADGLYHVRNRDAHAWPEVWLGRDIGWYAFEPTPGHADPLTGRGSAGGNSTPNTATTPTTQPASSPTTLAGTNTTPTVPGGGNAKLPSSTAAA
ncbi:MAG TPA: transglutaminaseTgpA domain-containing protein, partial [Acidimicrobiia bacterium]|nr:transglutaminaseTgpA domain-containing protein [Acidimicrobiia bacterium]